MVSGLIDYAAPGLVSNLLVYTVGSNAYGALNVFGLLVQLAALGFLIYNTGYLQGTTGQSLGKRVAGTKLIKESTGQPIGFGFSVLRYIAHFLDALPLFLGYFWPLWDAKRQTFADKICSTVVLARPPIR